MCVQCWACHWRADDSLRVLPPASATSCALPAAAMDSLSGYACVRRLGDVGAPSILRTPGDDYFELHPELKSPVRVELEVHRQPRCEAAASPSDAAFAAAASSAPLVMGIAGRTCEYCRQWLQAQAARTSAAASGAGGAAAASPPFVTHMYFSADGVPQLHAVMTDSHGERSSVPHDAPLYLLLAIHSLKRAFRLPNGKIAREFSEFVDVGAACTVWEGVAWVPACGTLRHLCGTCEPSICFHRGHAFFRPSALAGEPPYEAVLGLGKVWVNGRLVVDPPPAAYAPREGDAHPSGIDPASVRLAELRVAAMAAAIARGDNKAEAVASGHAAVAAAAAVAEGRVAGTGASEGYGAGGTTARGAARAGEGVGSAGAGSAEIGSGAASGIAP